MSDDADLLALLERAMPFLRAISRDSDFNGKAAALLKDIQEALRRE